MENQIMDDIKYKIDTKFVDEFSKEIYEPVLAELKKHGITFVENRSAI